MATEITATREHLEAEVVELMRALIKEDLKRAENHAITIITLIHHLKRLEQQHAVT